MNIIKAVQTKIARMSDIELINYEAQVRGAAEYALTSEILPVDFVTIQIAYRACAMERSARGLEPAGV